MRRATPCRRWRARVARPSRFRTSPRPVPPMPRAATTQQAVAAASSNETGTASTAAILKCASLVFNRGSVAAGPTASAIRNARKPSRIATSAPACAGCTRRCALPCEVRIHVASAPPSISPSHSAGRSGSKSRRCGERNAGIRALTTMANAPASTSTQPATMSPVATFISAGTAPSGPGGGGSSSALVIAGTTQKAVHQATHVVAAVACNRWRTAVGPVKLGRSQARAAPRSRSAFVR